MKTLSVIILFLGMSTWTFAQKQITLLVKENTVPCEGVAPMDCLQVKEGTAKTWSNFYTTIKGFNYKPGYQYKLTVIKKKLTGPLPADASAYSYQLKKIVYKRKVKVPASITSYLNKKMILTQLNGKAINNGRVYLTIDNARHTIFGKSGCNRFNTGYQLNGNTITINQAAGTLMACDEASMKLEQEFTTVLDKKTFEIHAAGNSVHFKDPVTKAVMLGFEIPSEKDIWSFIDGKKWKLIQLENVGKDYGKAFIRFDTKNKKVSGNGGCNNFFGTYTAKADEIIFSALGSTKMACPDKETTDTEFKMLQHLSAATVRFDVAEQTLNFYKNDKLIMLLGMEQ